MIHVDVIFVLYYFHLMRSLARIQFNSIENTLLVAQTKKKNQPISVTLLGIFQKYSFDILEVVKIHLGGTTCCISND